MDVFYVAWKLQKRTTTSFLRDAAWLTQLQDPIWNDQAANEDWLPYRGGDALSEVGGIWVWHPAEEYIWREGNGAISCCPANTKHLYNTCTMLTNVEDVGPTLYKCYTNVLCLLDDDHIPRTVSGAGCWTVIRTASGAGDPADLRSNTALNFKMSKIGAIAFC